MNDTKTENRLSQIQAEIERLQESIDENYEKFAYDIQRAFSEEKRVEVSGHGKYNGVKAHWKDVYVYTKLSFVKNNMRFLDENKDSYAMKIRNITKVEITEMETEDGIPD
jgi:flagellin-like hook-associated protein FlgL